MEPPQAAQRHPALEQADEALRLDRERLDAERAYRDSEEARLARFGIKCWLLAPTIEIYEALMAGQAVPLDKLNPAAVRKYGLR